jgi:TPP-dependent 2-oxoacid decarboxylase
LLGTQLAAPQRRQILLIGDGSFQLTVQELSTMLRQGLAPVIVLINNDGYTIERVIHGARQSYNAIQAWQYHQLPAMFAVSSHPVSLRVTTEEELEDALEQVEQCAGRLCFLEVVMQWDDAPENLKQFGKIVETRNGFAESGAR